MAGCWDGTPVGPGVGQSGAAYCSRMPGGGLWQHVAAGEPACGGLWQPGPEVGAACGALWRPVAACGSLWRLGGPRSFGLWQPVPRRAPCGGLGARGRPSCGDRGGFWQPGGPGVGRPVAGCGGLWQPVAACGIRLWRPGRLLGAWGARGRAACGWRPVAAECCSTKKKECYQRANFRELRAES